MIRVLNIITSNLKPDGITTSWLTVCKELKIRNLNEQLEMDFPYSIGGSDNLVVKKFSDLGITTIEMPSRNKNPLKYTTSLIHLLKSKKYDILHVNGSSNLMALDLFAGYLAGVKVRIAHSRNTSCKNRALHKIMSIPFKVLTTGRLACGYDAGKWLFHEDAFEILHNGKDFSLFNFSEDERIKQRKKLGINDKVVIAHVGRFNQQKNHGYLIDIFYQVVQYIPNSILMLIGSGECLKSIKEKVHSLNLTDKVIFTGAVSDISDKLQAADLMVFPSLNEGLPNVVLEWQAMGLPSLISDTITKECAVTDLVEFDDIQKHSREWASHILNMLKVKRDRNVSSKLAKKSLKQSGFDIKDTAIQLYDFYKIKLKEV